MVPVLPFKSSFDPSPASLPPSMPETAPAPAMEQPLLVPVLLPFLVILSHRYPLPVCPVRLRRECESALRKRKRLSMKPPVLWVLPIPFSRLRPLHLQLPALLVQALLPRLLPRLQLRLLWPPTLPVTVPLSALSPPD